MHAECPDDRSDRLWWSYGGVNISIFLSAFLKLVRLFRSDDVDDSLAKMKAAEAAIEEKQKEKVKKKVVFVYADFLFEWILF